MAVTDRIGRVQVELTVRAGDVLREPSELGMLASCEDVALPAEVAALFEPRDFSGKAKQTLLLYPRGAVAPRRLLLVGLGKRQELDAESIRQVAASAVRQAREMQIAAIALGANGELPLEPELVGQAFAEGIELGAYRYWPYRTGLTTADTFAVERATVFTSLQREEAVRRGVGIGQAIARGQVLARDLVNSPGYSMTPPKLAEEAEAVGKRSGVRVTVWDRERLISEQFGGIMAVGKGSPNDPRFIVLEYGEPGPDTPTICLVGKGLTFDSGGLSLKPADAMETMKNDMSGAAAVIGTMQVVSELNLPLHVVGLVSAAENMPSGEAYRPGDIVTTLSGKTIEVLNTDAEGRIILSDALFYAQRYKPAAIINIATLTGAMIIALGSQVTGMMGTSKPLADRFYQAGQTSGERVWELPLWQDYHDMIKSEVADLKNMGGRPAGSLTAGAFLASFVGDYPFVHLDIAGTSWVDKPSKPYEVHGGTGVGVRLLTEYLRHHAQ